MDIKRKITLLLALVLILGLAYGIIISSWRKSDRDKALAEASAVVEVRGMVGSEKESYFADPKVIERLAQNGLKVRIDKVGSRDIATRPIEGYDFAFPSGAPAALALQAKHRVSYSVSPFFTPMAIASWKPLLPILEAENLVKKQNDAYYVVDMPRLLHMVEEGVRWRDLKENAAFNSSKSVLVSTTDVRKSNSAAMFLALASYIANGGNVVVDQEQVQKLTPFMASLFLRQGLQESSSAGPFEDYTTMGMGKAPLVMIYESQYLEYQSRRSQPNPDMVLLYPQPTMYTKHIVVPFNDKGRKLADLLAGDAELQQIASRYGYRTNKPEQFEAFLKASKLQAPLMLSDVVEPPGYELLEDMIRAIEQKYQ